MADSNQRSNPDMIRMEALHQKLLEELRQNHSIVSQNHGEYQMKNGKSLDSLNLEEIFNVLLPEAGHSNINLDESPLNVPVPAPNIDVAMKEPQQQQELINSENIDNIGSLQQQKNGLETCLLKPGIITFSDLVSDANMVENYENQYENFQPGNINPMGANMGKELNFLAQLDPVQNNVMGNVVAEDKAGNICTGLKMGHAATATLDLNGSKATRLKGQIRESLERSQRRMMKNRESAARSRARKQAYAMEMENEVKRLRAENSKLKFELERVQRKTKLEAESNDENKHTKAEKAARRLRRSSSVSW